MAITQTTWLNNGTYYYSPKMSKQMRMQAGPRYIIRQFVDIKEGLGANAGDTVEFKKKLRIDTRGGTLTETNTMPTNRIKIVKDSVTVTEYGNAVDYTQKATTLSDFDMRDEYQSGLIDDQHDVLDRAACTQFQSAKYKCVCSATDTTTFTTDGTATATAGVNPSDKNMRRIVEYAKKRHIPKLGSFYIAILSTDAMGGVYDYLEAIAQYADPKFRFNDEIGKYYGARFIEENNVLSNSIGSSSKGEGLFFGGEAVTEAVALSEELRYEETDLGRSKKLAWYFIGGFKKTWDLDNDDQNSTNQGIERIIHITSA